MQSMAGMSPAADPHSHSEQRISLVIKIHNACYEDNDDGILIIKRPAFLLSPDSKLIAWWRESGDRETETDRLLTKGTKGGTTVDLHFFSHSNHSMPGNSDMQMLMNQGTWMLGVRDSVPSPTPFPGEDQVLM